MAESEAPIVARVVRHFFRDDSCPNHASWQSALLLGEGQAIISDCHLQDGGSVTSSSSTPACAPQCSNTDLWTAWAAAALSTEPPCPSLKACANQAAALVFRPV